jgi:nitroreductase
MEFNEVIKRRRMVHAFTAEPLAPGTAERLLRAANRAPSAGFSQGYSFLVLEGKEEAAPFWQLAYEQTASEATTKDDSPEQVDALSTAPLVIVPLASKDVYLDRYARPEKGWTDRDEARMPIPYWYIDTGFTALLILLAAVDEGLGAVFFGPPDIADFRARFGVPDGWTPIGAIAVGHPDLPADPVPPARASERKSLDELVHRGRWQRSLAGPVCNLIEPFRSVPPSKAGTARARRRGLPRPEPGAGSAGPAPRSGAA